MIGKKTTLNQNGFTLVEIIAVLIIMSVLAAIVVPRFIDLDANARLRAIDSAVAELNGRESLIWADTKISEGGYTDDTSIWDRLRWDETDTPQTYPDLGGDYNWDSTTRNGISKMSFGSQNQDWVAINRSPSTIDKPAQWVKAP